MAGRCLSLLRRRFVKNQTQKQFSFFLRDCRNWKLIFFFQFLTNSIRSACISFSSAWSDPPSPIKSFRFVFIRSRFRWSADCYVLLVLRVNSSTSTKMSASNKSAVCATVQVFLRILTILASLAATILMVTSKQSTVVYGIPLQAQYNYSTAFKY